MRAGELTVAIPTRGRKEILARTLKALAAQSAGGFETIVVLDGEDQPPPDVVPGLADVRVLAQAQAGPGVARNLAARSSRRPLLLLLGDDMIPAPDLVERHLERHSGEPSREVAVLGRAHPHPEVQGGRIERWLEWSGAQFDYRQLEREEGDEAGFGRFYSCNVSLKRELFEAAGGFDPEFVFDYEDLDLAWRLHELGMVLRYEPRAITLHLHRHDWDGVQRRYEGRARGEWLMASKHEWFTPWFHERAVSAMSFPAASGMWPRIVEKIPARLGRLRARAEANADLWYQQALAPRFLAAWDEASGGLDDPVE